MHKGRLEAFSDGVIAIIITIMVLEIKVPHDVSLEALLKLGPIFLSYVISFLYLGIYWNKIIITSFNQLRKLMVEYYGRIYFYFSGCL